MNVKGPKNLKTGFLQPVSQTMNEKLLKEIKSVATTNTQMIGQTITNAVIKFRGPHTESNHPQCFLKL